jgi:phospholipase C
MNESRRAFIKKATLLTGATGLSNLVPEAIQKALAINAAPGSTYLDAAHVVFLMQENRSFDHCFGALKGVRGFNDPRAIRLANNNPVWLQSHADGKTYAPFRLNLKDTKSTWMSSLPHSWENQVDARNNGKHDNWLDAKKSGNPQFEDMPLTMGYYNREDLPFYYALADAFTVCDQHFCSSLTGTSSNRLFFWSGTIRAAQNENSKAHVWNSEIDHKDLNWTTFPEQLEEHGISWKIYQNELSIPVGLEGEEEDWLSNFTDNDLEFFKQYNVRLHPQHIAYLEKQAIQLPKEIVELKKTLSKNPNDHQSSEQLIKKVELLKKIQIEKSVWTKERFDKLTEREKNIHKKAFVTNINDPDYHQLINMTYDDQGEKREMKVPKGDILHQFRADVEANELPTVTWLVPPSNFSDHPGAPWYGAWYISEVMDILTKNEEVWKKTIFILTYDENDGYFDHVPPFIPPQAGNPSTGKTSNGLDTTVEHVSMQQEIERGYDEKRASAMGLGFRVPMIVASPWSKGGYVNSQVFDHTSNLQFLEHWLSAKTGKNIKQQQISDWRRCITGNLTSIFRVAEDVRPNYPQPIKKNTFFQSIHSAKYKALPSAFKLNQLPTQEPGIKPSTALPYQLEVDAVINLAERSVILSIESKKEIFGEQTAGAPFIIYFPGKTVSTDANGKLTWANMNSRNYAVKPGDRIYDHFPLNMFEGGQYHIQVYGPNGFFREYIGGATDPDIFIRCSYQKDRLNDKKLSGNVEIIIASNKSPLTVLITDNAYHNKPKTIQINKEKSAVILNASLSYGWYDFNAEIKGNEHFKQRFAGRVETGVPNFSDPFMGRVKR